MSTLWLFLDKLITAPFFLIGYTASAAVSTFKYGYFTYEVNYRKAQEGKL